MKLGNGFNIRSVLLSVSSFQVQIVDVLRGEIPLKLDNLGTTIFLADVVIFIVATLILCCE